jgi:hypothetical protein
MIIEVEQISPISVDATGAHPIVAEIVLAEFGIVGPPGPQGPAGDVSAFNVGDLQDVTVTAPAEGDVLVFTNNQFRNRPGVELVDGGNF